MAMMISKFNALIRSRLLWGVFLVVIVLSFVVWGMPSCTRDDGGRGRGAEGVLDGREISSTEFRAAYQMACLDVLLKTGRDAFRGEDSAKMLREAAWRRLASLGLAEKWNLRAGEDEVRQSIAFNFAGQDGAFDRAAYEQFYLNRVRPAGFSKAQFEAYFAQDILLRKVAAVMGGQARVAPEETRLVFHTLMDTFEAEYVKIEAEPLRAGIQVGDDEAKALFDEDPDRFRLPEKREVQYALVPAGDGADIEIADSEVEEYYSENYDDYETMVTGEDGAVETVVTPLDDAREGIVTKLRAARALEAAETAATALCGAAMPGRDGTRPDFGEVVKARGLECRSAGPFAAGETPVPEYGAAFAAEAFQRTLGAFDAVSDPIPVEGGWLVLKLTAIQEPRTPEFDEVRDAAREAAFDRALDEALQAKAAEVKAAAEETSLDEAAAKFGLSASAEAPFTGFEGAMSTNAVLRALAAATATANPGEVAEAVPVEGGLLLAQLKARTPADEESFEAQSGEISGMLIQRRAAELGDLWEKSLLAGLEDLHPIADAEDEDEGEGGAVEDAAAADGEP